MEQVKLIIKIAMSDKGALLPVPLALCASQNGITNANYLILTNSHEYGVIPTQLLNSNWLLSDPWLGLEVYL